MARTRFSPFVRSLLAALRSMLPFHPSAPPHVHLNGKHVHYIASENGVDFSWLPVESTQSFKSVIPVDEKQILLGWKKHGFGHHHFGPFSVSPERGQDSLIAATRDLEAAAGIKATDIVSMGRILFVEEGSGEAREEIVFRASSWTGNLIETDSYIPARFHIPGVRTTPTPTSPTSTSSSSYSSDTSSSYSGYSTDTLPSFLDLTASESAIKPTLSLHSLVSSIFLPLWGQSFANKGSRDSCLPDLLPWHCMHADDKIWYPLLISGKKFVGRVDYAAGGQGEIRKWWFAVLED